MLMIIKGKDNEKFHFPEVERFLLGFFLLFAVGEEVIEPLLMALDSVLAELTFLQQ